MTVSTTAVKGTTEEEPKYSEEPVRVVYGDLDDFIFMDQEYHCSDR